jgi:ribosomal silencing factor RsfS
MLNNKTENKIIELVEEAIAVEGGHHKQWYLVEIAKILGININGIDEGVPN